MDDISDISSPAGRKSSQPSSAKKPTSAQILSEVPRKDTAGPKHGPHLNPGELQKSEVWKSHRSAKEAKSAKKSA